MDCMICTEDLLSQPVGELDCCEHSFCAKCILKWAEKDSRCPACRGRFRSVTEKVLDSVQPAAHCAIDEEMKHSKQMLGKVLKVYDIPERNQRPDVDDPDFYFSDAEDDPMNEVFCVECGGGDDEQHLLLCDGCDCACHTYCANLPGIPEDEWFCHGCTEERERTNQGRLSAIIGNPHPGAPTNTPPATQRLTRSSADASGGRAAGNPRITAVIDLITPEEPSPPPRPRLRRLYRRRTPGNAPVEVGTTADFLAALEARANSRTAGDPPSHAHRRLESLRQRWARIRQGQADFGSPAGNNTNSSPDSNGVSGGSSSTRVSSGSGQPTEQPSRPAARGGHTEADAAFAALDDAIELRRPSVRRAAAAGTPSRSREALGSDGSRSADKRKRDDSSERTEVKRPAVRNEPRQLRRPRPRERSGSLLSLSRQPSRQQPPQATALASRHGPFSAASPRQSTPVRAGSGQLHRADSASRDQNHAAGMPANRPEIQLPSPRTAAGSVPQRQRAGAHLRDSHMPRQPPHPPAHTAPYASDARRKPQVGEPWSSRPQTAGWSSQPGAELQQQPLSSSNPQPRSWAGGAPGTLPGSSQPGPLLQQQHALGSLPPPVRLPQPQPWAGGASGALHSPTSGGLAGSHYAAQEHTSAAGPEDRLGPVLPWTGAQQQQQQQAPWQAPQAQHPTSQPSPHQEQTQAALERYEAWYRDFSQSSPPGAQHPSHPSTTQPVTTTQDVTRPASLTTGSSRREDATDLSSPGTLGKHQLRDGHAQSGSSVASGLSEKEAVKFVKPLLKPLYAEELLDRDQFKDVAKRATQVLCAASKSGTKDPTAAVKETLYAMGLVMAASRVC